MSSNVKWVVSLCAGERTCVVRRWEQKAIRWWHLWRQTVSRCNFTGSRQTRTSLTDAQVNETLKYTHSRRDGQIHIIYCVQCL